MFGGQSGLPTGAHGLPPGQQQGTSMPASAAAPSVASTDRLFLELDRVRKMQVELSLTHLAQAAQFPSGVGEDDKDDDALKTYRRNNAVVAEREDKVRILVDKLNELTSAIDTSVIPNAAPAMPGAPWRGKPDGGA